MQRFNKNISLTLTWGTFGASSKSVHLNVPFHPDEVRLVNLNAGPLGNSSVSYRLSSSIVDDETLHSFPDAGGSYSMANSRSWIVTRDTDIQGLASFTLKAYNGTGVEVNLPRETTVCVDLEFLRRV